MPSRRPRRSVLLAVLSVLAGGLLAGCGGGGGQQGNARERFHCKELTRLTTSTAHERAALAAQLPGPTAVFFGDSYTQGVGLPDIKDDYAYVTARQLHWTPILNAAGGTGYVSGGPCHGKQLSSRVGQVAAHHPTYVVIQAGLDDYTYSQQRIQQAARSLYAQLHRALPGAKLYAVGPHPTPKVRSIDNVRRALRQATSAAHVTYIDTMSWSFPFQKGGIHPSVKGHRIYGQDLATAIRRAGQPG